MSQISLEPGGTLFLDELDTIFYREKDIPQSDASGHDLNLCMAGDDWISKTNCVYTGFSLHRGFLAECVRVPLSNALTNLRCAVSHSVFRPC